MLGGVPQAADGLYCQTEETLSEMRLSVAMVGASSTLWGLCLLRYFVRECGRRTERGLHLVEESEGKHVVAGFLDLGFAEEEEGVSDLLHEEVSSTASRGPMHRRHADRRQRLYVPPLPKSVLRSLKTVSGEEAEEAARGDSFGRKLLTPAVKHAPRATDGEAASRPAKKKGVAFVGQRVADLV